MTTALTWADVVSPEPDRTLAFYTAVFGWTVHPVPGIEFDYRFLHDGGRPVAGFEPIPADGSKGTARWTVMARTADVDATAAAAEAAGGRITFAPEDMGAAGRCGMITDPSGATVGIWTSRGVDPAVGATGSGVVGAARSAPDPEALVPFYEEVLGWRTVSRGRDGEVLLDAGGTPARLHRGAPPWEWAPVLLGTDPSAVVARVVEAGGNAEEDRPGLWSIVDPVGARLLLTGEGGRGGGGAEVGEPPASR